VRAVASGDALLGQAVAQRVLQHFAVAPASASALAPSQDPAQARAEALAELTAREVEVLRLIARGVRNRQIAEQLVIAEKTVANYVSSIYSKLQVADRVERCCVPERPGWSERSSKGGLHRRARGGGTAADPSLGSVGPPGSHRNAE